MKNCGNDLIKTPPPNFIKNFNLESGIMKN